MAIPEPPEASSSDRTSTPEAKPPVFIHEREFRDALRVVTLIASGRNPFGDEPFEKLRPDHRDVVLQALCVIATYLSDSKPVHDKDSPKPLVDPAVSDPSSKRPLEEYLQRVEREAILEALAETNYNRTSAARLLGITFRALRYRMENLGLDKESDNE